MTILKVKQANGEILNVPFGVGADGKTAYEYAKESGYSGTEEDFGKFLGTAEEKVKAKVQLIEWGEDD